jgi:hypothetical protein
LIQFRGFLEVISVRYCKNEIFPGNEDKLF